MNFALLADYPNRSQINQELVGALMWYVPILIVCLFLILGPVLRRHTVSNLNVHSLIGAVLLVVGGVLVAGLAAAATIGFGLCYGEDCSEIKGAMPSIIMALLSLVLTVPIARRLLKNGSQPSDTQIVLARRQQSKLLLGIGVVVLFWSSLVYIPRIINAISSY